MMASNNNNNNSLPAVATRSNNPQQIFQRQATILRKNLVEADATLRRGSDWPNMLGRWNAAYNQTTNLDGAIQDVWEHFVFLPKQSTANPGDIPFFLSTRLDEAPAETTESNYYTVSHTSVPRKDPVQQLIQFEKSAGKIVSEYESNLVRFG